MEKNFGPSGFGDLGVVAVIRAVKPPENPLGQSALRTVRAYEDETKHVAWSKSGRMGLDFLETDANQRPSPVVYDREGSSVAWVEPSQTDWPKVSTVPVTLRESHSADRNGWSALVDATDDIVDRVGGGDSFSAGLMSGRLGWPGQSQKSLEFAVTASCLMHSVSGDFDLSTKAEVEALLAGDGWGRGQRWEES